MSAMVKRVSFSIVQSQSLSDTISSARLSVKKKIKIKLKNKEAAPSRNIHTRRRKKRKTAIRRLKTKKM